MLKNKFKIQKSKCKIAIKNSKFLILNCIFTFYILNFTFTGFAQEQFIYDAKGRRDPFIALVTPEGRILKLEQEEEVKGLLLEGIIYDKNGLSYAIINNLVVKIGDTVGDYQVLKIEKNRVILIKEGQSLEVELKKEEP